MAPAGVPALPTEASRHVTLPVGLSAKWSPTGPRPTTVAVDCERANKAGTGGVVFAVTMTGPRIAASPESLGQVPSLPSGRQVTDTPVRVAVPTSAPAHVMFEGRPATLPKMATSDVEVPPSKNAGWNTTPKKFVHT